MLWKHIKYYIAFVLALSGTSFSWAKGERDTLGVGTQVTFVENLGQWDMRVRFEAQLHNAALFLEADGLTVALRDPIPHPLPPSSLPRYHAYKMHFLGATPTEPAGSNPLPGYNNYFLGNDPSKWHSRVGLYGSVRYNELYPGIALEVYGGS